MSPNERPVENATCESIDLKVICKWQKKKNFVPIDFTGICGNPSLPSEWFVNNENITDVSATWKLSPKRTARTVILQIYFKKDNGNSMVSFSFESIDIMKLSQIKNFAVERKNAWKLNLYWNRSKNIFPLKSSSHANIVHELEYNIVHSKIVKYINISSTNETLHYQLSKDIIPCTKYEIRIRYVIADKYNGKWSKWSPWSATVSSETEKDYPHPPTLHNDAFEVQVVDDHKQNMLVYWKKLTSEQKFCSFKYFNITVESENGLSKYKADENADSLLIKNLENNKDYSIKIFSMNEVGKSRNYSELQLKKAENIPMKAENINFVKVNDGCNTSVHWTSSQQNITNFTVYWCHISENDACDSDLNSLLVNSTQTSSMICVKGPLKQHKIGVATNTLYASTGIIWKSLSVKSNINIVMYFSILLSLSIIFVSLYKIVHHSYRKCKREYSGNIILPDGLKTIPEIKENCEKEEQSLLQMTKCRKVSDSQTIDSGYVDESNKSEEKVALVNLCPSVQSNEECHEDIDIKLKVNDEIVTNNENITQATRKWNYVNPLKHVKKKVSDNISCDSDESSPQLQTHGLNKVVKNENDALQRLDFTDKKNYINRQSKYDFVGNKFAKAYITVQELMQRRLGESPSTCT
ncbi:Cytokine receptor-like protein [Leptotrombidium deliense]|uniref:Cytokine receptor-like protein n=1 Tax=Leptotrombidium deliense TaxID=299467 RepID=A0A443SDI1_9ACAR|nr:Cytokine receptor-like protein [Leptotrombidium deliense]